MMDAGYWDTEFPTPILDDGCWILGYGVSNSDSGYWVDFGYLFNKLNR
jgi:hypothetical protein